MSQTANRCVMERFWDRLSTEPHALQTKFQPHARIDNHSGSDASIPSRISGRINTFCGSSSSSSSSSWWCWIIDDRQRMKRHRYWRENCCAARWIVDKSKYFRIIIVRRPVGPNRQQPLVNNILAYYRSVM